MTTHRVELLGFGDDDAIDEMFRRFGLLEDYKSYLAEHLTEVLRKQHPSVELRSLELVGMPNCSVGGMPSPNNEKHVIVDSVQVPLDLKIRLSTTGNDLHELYVTLVIKTENMHGKPSITSDMFVREHLPMS